MGGIVGPTAFIAAWAIGGMRSKGYSPVHDAISRLAAVHAPTQSLMTTGFVAFGLGVPLYGLALRREVPGPAWVAAVTTGVATLGVAAAPLDVSSRVDLVHGAFASAGYASLAALPLLAARGLERDGRRGWARASRVVGVASAVSLIATVAGPAHGLFQRAGLTIGDAWIVATALSMIRHDSHARLPS
ncbi:MAG TPA: DUF998 domain-containing protein [Acidimicrobiales bacterium]|nr:DUF998 domain-containing protein [Acidimicrobiales bacterium]